MTGLGVVECIVGRYWMESECVGAPTTSQVHKAVHAQEDHRT